MNKKYKLEVWSYGYKSEEFETDDYNEIRKRVMNYLNIDVGIKLFIDGNQIPYLEIKKKLNINIYRNI